MVLTITREEVENLVREKYTLPEEIKILIKETDTHSVAPLKVSVNNENFVQDIVTDKQDVPSAFMEGGTVIKASLTRMTEAEKESAYERYAENVEAFLKSGKKEQWLDLENRAPSTMRYRYNTAIKMYGYESQVYATATDHGGKGHARLVRKE